MPPTVAYWRKLLDTLVNKGKKKGRGVFDPAQLSISLRAVGVDTLSAS